MLELIQLLNHFAPLPPDLCSHLESNIKKKKYKKGAIICARGEIADSIFYIEQGLVRCYYILGRKEVSHWFMDEGNICISVQSFLNRKPAQVTLVALEDCICWEISHKQLEKIYQLFPGFNIHGRLILSKYYCESEDRSIALKLQSPQQKYDELMRKDPQLVLRVKNKYMASYLDVSDRTYNLIRKVYREKKRK